MYRTSREIDFLGKKLPEGSSITKQKDGSFKDKSGKFIFDKDTIDSNPDLFKEIKFSIDEVKDSDVKQHWRIQMDVKCNLTQLKKIQLFLEENINKILGH